MPIDNSFMIKRIETFDSILLAVCAATHHPFIECDENTYDDQAFLFTDEEMFRGFAERWARDKIILQGARIPKAQIKKTLQSLYWLGVNSVVVQDEGAPVTIELEKLAEKPDLEALENDRLPRANPLLQLTGLYFMQQLTRKVERTKEEKKQLRDLEEEMAHNMFRSRFILAFDLSGNKGKFVPGRPGQKIGVPLIKRKDGSLYMPVYSDMGEFQRYNRKTPGKKMQIMAVPYEKLMSMLPPNAKGFVFNPGGFHLSLSRDQMAEIKRRYKQEEEEE